MGTKVAIKHQDKTADQPGFQLSWDCIMGLGDELDSPIFLEFTGAPFTIDATQNDAVVCIEMPRVTAGALGLTEDLDLQARDAIQAAKESYFSNIDKEMLAKLLKFMDGAVDILGSREAALEWICTPNQERDGKRPVDMLFGKLGGISVLLDLHRSAHDDPL